MAKGKASERWTLRPEALGHFLSVLSEDVSEAARRYETLRSRLIRIFEWRAARFAEELADETISRLVQKLEEGLELASEDVPRYAAGIAHRVHLERLREEKRGPSPADLERPPWVLGRHTTTDVRLSHLEEFLEDLTPAERDLILRYYGSEGGSRIAARKSLARELGVSAANLRIRAYRIRGKLEDKICQRLARYSHADHGQRSEPEGSSEETR